MDQSSEIESRPKKVVNCPNSKQNGGIAISQHSQLCQTRFGWFNDGLFSASASLMVWTSGLKIVGPLALYPPRSSPKTTCKQSSKAGLLKEQKQKQQVQPSHCARAARAGLASDAADAASSAGAAASGGCEALRRARLPGLDADQARKTNAEPWETGKTYGKTKKQKDTRNKQNGKRETRNKHEKKRAGCMSNSGPWFCNKLSHPIQVSLAAHDLLSRENEND